VRIAAIAFLLLPLLALAEDKEKVVAGEVVEVSRKMILPNWEPTAKAVTRNIEKKCFPTAAEALAQLDYFYQILEIAKTKVPKDDPIAKGQPARKAEIDKLREALSKSPRVNTGCPEQSLTPKKRGT
jgi:hypothetical protein